eukprot:jgi/Mesen1/8367/ME000464S07764
MQHAVSRGTLVVPLQQVERNNGG